MNAMSRSGRAGSMPGGQRSASDSHMRYQSVTGRGSAAMIEIVGIETPELGDRAYLATDGVGAIVIDPQRDIDRVERLAAERVVPITHVFETHIHYDYVTGGLALARSTGAE